MFKVINPVLEIGHWFTELNTMGYYVNAPQPQYYK